ncbi:MAG TPA: hypothetical protein VK157_16605 [Phycisphaerales bacterium]|nr:hypothetical protein [Phycisphaerales bacterium]
MRSALLLFALVPVLPLLPGCIAWEIRDQLKTVNAQLAEVNGSVTVTHSEIQQVKTRLNTMNADLSTTNDKLLEANTKLVDVQSGLTRVDTTNSSLGTLDQQLTSMQASLTKIDAHLASLRGTIGKLDSAIPFLDLGGDAPVDHTAPAPAAPDAPVNPNATVATTPARDPLVGTWLQSDPTAKSKYILVLLADGSYILDTSPQAGLQRGTWKRDSQQLTLSYTATIAADPATSQPERSTTVTNTLAITAQTTRSLTLLNDETLIVLRRP